MGPLSPPEQRCALHCFDARKNRNSPKACLGSGRGSERWLVWAAVGTAGFLASWTVVRWPNLLANASLLTFVPPKRLGAQVGFFGVSALVIVIGRRSTYERITVEADRTTAVGFVVVMVGLVGWVATELRASFLPVLGATAVR
jgi:hypothetical protein